jgi:hypothetical protein
VLSAVYKMRTMSSAYRLREWRAKNAATRRILASAAWTWQVNREFPSHHPYQWRTAEGLPPHTGHQDIKPITSMEKEKKREKVIVVGAGPVGSLAALYAANRGNDVEVYELRGGKLRNNRQPFIAFSILLSGTRIFDCFANKRLPYFRELRFLHAFSTCLIGLEVTKLLRSIRRDAININFMAY